MVGESKIPDGRYPGNLVTDGSETVWAAFPQSLGQQGNVTGKEPSPKTLHTLGEFAERSPCVARGDSGSAARFFTKCEIAEEDYDIDHVLFYKKPTKKEKGEYNTHISVKPVSLMRHLIRLVTPKGGTVLDPFMGSGTTGVAAKLEGMKFVGFEMEQESFDIAARRISEIT